MGISFVHIGNDNSLSELLHIPSYYTDILLSVIVCYAIGFYLRWLTQQMDRLFDWESQLKPRIRFQLAWGLLCPTLFAVLIELSYLKLLGIPLGSSSILYLELPVILIYLVVLNLAYFILHYRQHTAILKLALSEQVAENEFIQEKYLIASQGNQTVHIPNSAIAYFFLKGKLTFIMTSEGKAFLFKKTMKEVTDLLPQNQFFSINRQVVARRSSIQKYTQTKTRRLKIELTPPHHDEVFLPKAKIGQFMKWLSQE